MQHVNLSVGKWVGRTRWRSPVLFLELFSCELLWYWSFPASYCHLARGEGSRKCKFSCCIFLKVAVATDNRSIRWFCGVIQIWNKYIYLKKASWLHTEHLNLLTTKFQVPTTFRFCVTMRSPKGCSWSSCSRTSWSLNICSRRMNHL